MTDRIELPRQGDGVWIVEFTWTQHEPEPPQVAVLLDAMMNDTPALLGGVECRIVGSDLVREVRVVSCERSIEWARKTVKFSLMPT